MLSFRTAPSILQWSTGNPSGETEMRTLFEKEAVVVVDLGAGSGLSVCTLPSSFGKCCSVPWHDHSGELPRAIATKGSFSSSIPKNL